VGHYAGGRSWGWGWHGDADDLVGAKVMSRGDTSARSADVEGLRELNELDTGSVHSPKENGYLEANAWRAALNAVQALTLLVNLDFQNPPGSTGELVRLCIFNAM
jgi:hypothetical protein